MDVGKDIRRTKAKPLAAIAQKGFVEGWLLDNQQNFIETMELIREGAPVQWAKLYADLYKIGITKETNLNININRQQDRENLQALIRTRINAPLPEYTQYEEVEKKELPVIELREEPEIVKRDVIEEDF